MALLLYRFGKADIKGLLQSTKKEEYLRHIIKYYEKHVWLGGNFSKNYKPKLAESMVQMTIIVDMVYLIVL